MHAAIVLMVVDALSAALSSLLLLLLLLFFSPVLFNIKCGINGDSDLYSDLTNFLSLALV